MDLLPDFEDEIEPEETEGEERKDETMSVTESESGSIRAAGSQSETTA